MRAPSWTRPALDEPRVLGGRVVDHLIEDDAQVAAAVAVGVGKAARIDLVEGGFFPPSGGFGVIERGHFLSREDHGGSVHFKGRMNSGYFRSWMTGCCLIHSLARTSHKRTPRGFPPNSSNKISSFFSSSQSEGT